MVYVFFDSGLCLEKKGHNPVECWKIQFQWSANWIELMENQWSSSGRSSQDSRQRASSMRFRKILGELQCDPADFIWPGKSYDFEFVASETQWARLYNGPELLTYVRLMSRTLRVLKRMKYWIQLYEALNPSVPNFETLFFRVRVTACRFTDIDRTACLLCRFSQVQQILFSEVTTFPFESVGQGLTSCDDLFRMCHCHCHCPADFKGRLIFRSVFNKSLPLHSAMAVPAGAGHSLCDLPGSWQLSETPSRVFQPGDATLAYMSDTLACPRLPWRILSSLSRILSIRSTTLCVLLGVRPDAECLTC